MTRMRRFFRRRACARGSRNSGVGSRRSGAVLAAALVCLLIVMLLAAAVARTMIARDRATRWDARQVQCLCLAESAVSRAIAKYRRDPSYMGESWTIEIPANERPMPGRAEVIVGPVSAEDPRRIVRVTAHWPDDPLYRVTRRIEFILPPAATGELP